ncbi:RNA-binding protein [Priestia endophytica]|uniref:YlmH family RNA-binding protein n=1 Tax=Priestia endophytica TaxID=135735 RepID=UPI003D2E0DD4
MTELYQHFRKEEHEFVDAVLEWQGQVLNQYSPKLTDFLDPREQEIVHTIIGSEGDVKVSFFGGYEGAERKRALLFPSYYEPSEEDYELELFEVKYASKFVTLEHRHVLGTLMSVGLRRSKYGDIIAGEERIQFIVARDMSSFVKMNISKMGKTSVALQTKPLSSVMDHKEELELKETTVSSLRLDAVLSSIHNISRQKVQTLINGGHAKVNWKTLEQPSFECNEGDTLSLKGHGRARVVSINGKTKKEKWRITVGKLK